MPKIADRSGQTSDEYAEAREEARALALGGLIWALRQVGSPAVAEQVRITKLSGEHPLHAVIHGLARRLAAAKPKDPKAVKQVSKVRAVLDFAVARALDAGLGDPTLVASVLRGKSGPSLDAFRIALDPSQQLMAKETLERICPIFRAAADQGTAATSIRDEYQRRLDVLNGDGPVRDWLSHQVEVWSDVVDTCAAAFQLADELPRAATLRPDTRAQGGYESLISRPRREQTRILNGDALRLHEEFKLSATEIGEIWNPGRPKADWKALGTKTLENARKSRRTVQEKWSTAGNGKASRKRKAARG